MKKIHIPLLLASVIAIMLVFAYIFFVSSQRGAIILPDTLHEVSGITSIGGNRIAAIQDEVGTVFIYDLQKKEIVDSFDFAEAGDYEDIAYDGERFYILRSDGVLFETANGTTVKYDLHTGAGNNEGLYYDQNIDRLLVATKSKVGKGDGASALRYIYSFDLATKILSPEPYLVIDITDIEEFAAADDSLVLEAKSGKKIIKFRPSGIALHPVTHDLYVLSSADNLIIVFGAAGEVRSVRQLDFEKFRQPEGITFLEDGTLLIANEGADEDPTIIQLDL